MYDFDKVINRKGTNAYKLDLRERYFGTEDVIPLWVADMDFAAPPEVQNAIQERAKHEVFGYTIRKASFNESVADWMNYNHQWKINPDWVEFSPGVVPALVMSVLAFSQPGDGVIIQTPVYPPFYNVVADNDRDLLKNTLIEKDGRYEINFEEFEEMASLPSTKIFILCNPHNPVGRVWNKEELLKINQICLQHKVLVLSDEIHSDLTLFGNKHIPFASLNEEAAANSIVFMAPSKTFNIAGFSTSYIIASNPKLLLGYRKKQNGLQMHMGHVFSGIITETAYNQGRQWLVELKDYLENNIRFVKQFIQDHLEGVKLIEPEATYLLWLDFKAWNLDQKQLKQFLIEEAKVGLNDGMSFGPEGKGFMRLNVASPRSVLEHALNRIANLK